MSDVSNTREGVRLLSLGHGVTRSALPESVDRVRPVIKIYVDRHGWGELLEVADELGVATDGAEGWGVWWAREADDKPVQQGQLHINLGDLQLIAFCAALAANSKAINLFYGTAV